MGESGTVAGRLGALVVPQSAFAEADKNVCPTGCENRNALDGEWTTGVTTYATSGDGVPGGDLCFRFNLVPGDVDQNGTTHNLDAVWLRQQLGAKPGDPLWSPFCDLDGSGQVHNLDFVWHRQNLGATIVGLPEPTLPSPPAPLKSLSRRAAVWDASLLEVSRELEVTSVSRRSSNKNPQLPLRLWLADQVPQPAKRRAESPAPAWQCDLQLTVR